jgi:hypothetical protein
MVPGAMPNLDVSRQGACPNRMASIEKSGSLQHAAMAVVERLVEIERIGPER